MSRVFFVDAILSTSQIDDRESQLITCSRRWVQCTGSSVGATP
jgi:hypothetical protein